MKPDPDQSQHVGPVQRPETDREERKKSFSRRAILHAGWAIPTVMAIGLPRNVLAQSGGGSPVTHGDADAPHEDGAGPPHADHSDSDTRVTTPFHFDHNDGVDGHHFDGPDPSYESTHGDSGTLGHDDDIVSVYSFDHIDNGATTTVFVYHDDDIALDAPGEHYDSGVSSPPPDHLDVHADGGEIDGFHDDSTTPALGGGYLRSHLDTPPYDVPAP
jgi:hypothetical protein